MSVRGSGALYDACGSVLVFAGEKGQPTVVEHEKARMSGRPHAGFRLSIEDVAHGDILNVGLRVSVLDGAGEEKAERRSAADRYAEAKEKTHRFIMERGPVTGGANLIRAALGLRKDDVCAAVEELIRSGDVKRTGSYKAPVLTASGTE